MAAQLIAFISSLIAAYIGFYLGRWRQGINENRGEGAVRKLLSKGFPSTEYHLLNNVTLPARTGTTQVDHILVSRYGLFIIEAKHYTGWLSANAQTPKWTQVLHREHHKFQDPISQNRLHISVVAKLLDFLPKEAIHSLVVFTGDAIFKTPKPQGVFALHELHSHILQQRNYVMSMNRMQFCVGRLECSRKAISRQTDVEHVAYLQKKFGSVE